METRNNVTEFILLGLTQNPQMQKVIFIVFLIVYMVSMVGNVLTVVTITLSPLLKSPMYYFLAHLSFIDACYSCVNTPKLILDSLYEKKTRLFNECMTQIFGEHFFGGADVILLTVMAYDCYAAISKPLYYDESAAMWSAGGSGVGGRLSSWIHSDPLHIQIALLCS